MRFCLSGACFGLVVLAVARTAAAGEPVRKVASIVSPDPRTGRLVRRVVVSPRRAAVRPLSPSHSPTLPLGEFIDRTAERYRLDPLLVHSVIQVESNYDPFAVSPKGAEGIMQLMPGTARRFRVRNSFDPWQNIEGGVRYLRYLVDLFGSPRLAVAAYNAGEGAVIKYGRIPPYPETSDYVHRVAARWGAARQAANQRDDPTPDRPSIACYTDSEGRPHYQNYPASSAP